MRLTAIRYSYGSLGVTLGTLPDRQRWPIIRNTTQLLTEGFRTRLPRRFSPSENSIDLSNYLLSQLAGKLPPDSTLALEWEKRRPSLVCYQEAGSIHKQHKISIASIAWLARNNRPLGDLLLAICAYVSNVTGAATWETGELWCSDFALDSLTERIYSDDFSDEECRDLRKSMARYGPDGIATRYARMLKRIPSSRAVKLAKSFISSSDADVAKMCGLFIELSKIKENLLSYRSDEMQAENHTDIQPVPLSQSFVLIWGDDHVQSEIDDTVNMHYQEASLERLFLKTTLVSCDGFNKVFKETPILPRVLERLFTAINKVVDSRKSKKRKRGRG